MDQPMPVKPVDETDSPRAIDNDVSSAPSGSTSNTATPSASSMVQSLMDGALGFLSEASNETLGACLLALALSTYFLLGRIGLIIIGFVGGIVLHATWDGSRGRLGGPSKEAEHDKKREVGVEVARRLLEWKGSLQTEDEAPSHLNVKVYAAHGLSYAQFGPETEAALNNFTDAVIKDYVHYWYDSTIPGEQTFPAYCRQTFVAFVLSLSAHLQRKRPADAFLDFVTNASSMILVFLSELATALNASPNKPVEEAVQAYLKMKPDSSLSYMLNEESQKLKLADAAEDVVQAYLDSKSYNCPPVHIFLKEVFAQLVLEYTVSYCSNPEWINDWIVYGLEESETTKEVMGLMDAGVESSKAEAKPQPRDSTSENKQASFEGADAIQAGSSLPQSDGTGESHREINEMKTPPKSSGRSETSSKSAHARNVSRAEEAMDEAMKEARRLTQMILEEDERRAREEKAEQGVAAPSISASVASLREDTPLQPPAPDIPASPPKETVAGISADESASVDGDHAAAKPQAPVTTGTSATASDNFLNFDQILASNTPAIVESNTDVDENGEDAGTPRTEAPPLTLHNAHLSLLDDSAPGERTSIKAKPTTDYLIQVEPADPNFPGWMIPRKYADFETLHEVLRRISVITGSRFTEAHSELPKWRVHTKSSLREELERYLSDAVHFQPLAESEGMKRFLEKERGLSRVSNGPGKGFGWPTPDAFGKLGGDMMHALTRGPKQSNSANGSGGRSVLGNVAGLVGGGKRASQSQTNLSRVSTGTNHDGESVSVENSDAQSGQPAVPEAFSPTERDSLESFHNSSPQTNDSQTNGTPQLSVEKQRDSLLREQRPSSSTSTQEPMTPDKPALPLNDVRSVAPPGLSLEETLNLPPPPSEMPEDYSSPTHKGRFSTEILPLGRDEPSPPQRSSPGKSATTSVTPASTSKPLQNGNKPRKGPDAKGNDSQATSDTTSTKPKLSATPDAPRKTPLTERETSVTIELIFAIITELYTLSSVWQIRRTLLSAAKTFILRPGNPQITSIRNLLQTSLLDANLNDAGLAHHISKLRANTLPTDEEREGWARDYPEKNATEKEQLRIRARKLLVTRGMPQALTSVMGAAGSREALGKVFDCLQVPQISRGLIFGLLLQALRVVTH